MRSKIVAGNWKMNKNLDETRTLIKALKQGLPQTKAEVMVAPAFVNLMAAVEAVSGSPIQVSAQNMYFEESGAFTGEIAPGMLKSIGVETVIIGHSERRAYFGEKDELLKKKVITALNNHMRVIFCFGEELEDRKGGRHFEVVENQLKNALFDLSAEAWKHIVLAYEPVWAIGTGETATPEQAQEMHAFIRDTISAAFGNTVSEDVSILYGGSVKPGNAAEIFSNPDVDGGLIGGAALNANDFIAIINGIA